MSSVEPSQIRKGIQDSNPSDPIVQLWSRIMNLQIPRIGIESNLMKCRNAGQADMHELAYRVMFAP